jgi:hypothetical protein
MSEAGHAFDGGAGEYRIRFVEQITNDDVVLMTFQDPAPRHAVLGGASATREGGDLRGDILDVLLLPLPSGSPGKQSEMAPGPAQWLEEKNHTGTPSILVKYRGVELTWVPGRAALQCDPGQTEALLSAVVEFAYYESELRRIEREIADAWVELDQDKALAFDVTPTDLERSEAVGVRMNKTLGRRIRFARIEPHLYEPQAELSAVSRKLGEELREKVRIETRLETVDGQLEVFEHVYEMSGQRMGEYRAAREEHVLEWVIILLLGAELLLLLVQTVWKRG